MVVTRPAPGALIQRIATWMPCVVMLVGPPGAGKTTLANALAAQLGNGTAVLSYAAHRAEISISGDPADPAADAAAGTLLLGRLRDRSVARLTTLVDGTHHLARTRAAVLAIATEAGLPAIAAVLSTPIPVCLTRQQDRPTPAPGKPGLRVPEPQVRAIARALANIRADLASDGFLVHMLNPNDTSDEDADTARTPSPN